ncbi:MAG: patatin-like phospholipase family protein [Bacteroidota bacterium]
MRALVISGGGSKGAWGGGVADYLLTVKGREYDILVGTSTGSLLVPHLAISNVAGIKHAYTNVRQSDIYNISPFNIVRTEQGTYTKINHRNILQMFLRGKKTFGEHKNLLKTIRKELTPGLYQRLLESKKKVIVSVSNLSLNTVEYKYASDYNYDDFTEWMWTSTSFVPFMGVVEKNGYEYADGGFGSLTPIEEAINAGATDIDVIVLNPRYNVPVKSTTNNAFDVLLKAMEFMHHRISRNDLYIGHLQSVYDPKVTVNFIFTPRVLTEHAFYFDPEQMMVWWQEGYDYARTLDQDGKL